MHQNRYPAPLDQNPVSAEDAYRLIDFGNGRKLESVGGYRIDRPCPAAAWSKPVDPSKWDDVDARFDANAKRWTYRIPWPRPKNIRCSTFLMPASPTPFGHIGFFPEQADNWRWLSEAAVDSNRGVRPMAMNLFGYTGASTMALVAAGYQVAHVDAAKPNVQAVRVAAEANGWSDPPIRFLIDDASKFTAREVRRGRRYHTIVLDPPAYGHGPSGRAWRLDRDLWSLLSDCLCLVDANDFRLLMTGHSPVVDESDIIDFFQQNDLIDFAGLRIESGRSQLMDEASRSLDAGFFVRVQSGDAARV